MSDNGVDFDVHLSRVATWMINTLGKAIAAAVLAAAVCAVIAAGAGEVFWVYLGGLLAPLAFAVVLYMASAPLPSEGAKTAAPGVEG